MPLTPELKEAIIAEAKELKQNYINGCKDPELAMFVDNSVLIKLAAEP